MHQAAMRVLQAVACTVMLLWPSVAGATFSIIARDPTTGEVGVAIASRVFAVRLAGPVIDPDVGVVARQSDVILKHGPRAMELLKSGLAPQEVLAQLLTEDLAPTHQMALIDVKGRVAASTGKDAMEWKGHKVGENYSVQGNILVGPQVIEAMAVAFERTQGPLAERLFAALKAGDDAGGDKRGRQSAFLQVVGRGAAVYGEPMVNIAVDDSLHPLQDLRRLLDAQTAWNIMMRPMQSALSAGNFKEARTLAARAAELKPWDQLPFLVLGLALYLENAPAEGLAALRKARGIQPESFKVWWELFRNAPNFKKIFDDKDFERQVFQ